MRTTVTLYPDTVALIERRMREQGVSFEVALNDAIREGAASTPAEPFRTESADLGAPLVNLDGALRVAADLEDDELDRRMRRGR